MNNFPLVFSREEDTQSNWIRIECELRNSPADSDTLSLAQLALDGLLQRDPVQNLIISGSTVVSGMHRTYLKGGTPYLTIRVLSVVHIEQHFEMGSP